MAEIAVLCLLVIFGIRFYLWLRRTRFKERRTSFSPFKVAENPSLFSLGIENNTVVLFPLERADDLSLQTIQELRGVGFRMLTEREFFRDFKYKYRNDKSLKKHILITFAPRATTEKLLSLQWADRIKKILWLKLKRQKVTGGYIKHENILGGIRFKRSVKSFESEMFLIMTRNEYNEGLEKLYESETRIMEFAKNKKEQALRLAQKILRLVQQKLSMQ